MNPIRNPQNQFFPINVILPEKQGKISNGVKKIIITFLLFFLLFGIGKIALATCYYGAEGYTGYYEKGKCYHVEGEKWYEDYCKNETTLVEYDCVGGVCSATEHNCSGDCHAGYQEHCFCSGGKCVKERYCWETDLFKDIYSAGGTSPDKDCTEWEGTTRKEPYWDTCTGNVLTEYYCGSDGKCHSFNVDCSAIGGGGTCSASPRICTIKPENCYDSDEGINSGIKGRCTDHSSLTISGNEDTCVDDDNLTEYYCEKELKRCVYKTVSCPEGCIADKCIGVVPVVEPLKPIGANECCLLNYNLTDVDENCEKGKIIGPLNPQWCDLNNDGTMDTIEKVTIRWGVCCFLNSLYKISDWLAWFALPLAILVSLAGAFNLTTSGGDPQKVNKGRDYIVWAVLGAVVCFLIKAILAIIKTVV